MNVRRAYKITPVTINGRSYFKVIIDPHYESKHSAKINDELILRLVSQLDGIEQLAEVEEGIYSYFVRIISLEAKVYRLIWLLDSSSHSIGVINVFRDKKGRLQ